MSAAGPTRLGGARAVRGKVSSRAGPAVAFVPGVSVERVEEIDSLAELGRRAQPHRLCLAPAMTAMPQLPLFEPGALPEEVVRAHHEALPPPAVHVYGLPDHELAGGGFLHRRGQLFLHGDVKPGYFTAYLNTGSLPPAWAGALYDTPAKVIEVDVPLAVPFHPNLVYGHFLLEMLPRLHLLSRLRRLGLPFMVAAPDSAPGWARRVLALYFEPEEILWYGFATERVRSPCFILPSMMQNDHWFHPEFNLAADELREFVLPQVKPSSHRRVWLSRRGHEGLHGMLNEAAVEDSVAALGFEIVDPLRLSFAEQMALMDGARIIAGGYGSAMHNSLFARRGTKVFCVNRANWYQSAIGALRGQPMAYLPPEDGRFRDWRVQGTRDARYVVDCAALRERLARFEAWQTV